MRIPRAPQEVSAAWLEEVLREAGALGDTRIVDLTSEPIGDDRGFIGSVTRFRFGLEPRDETAPHSVVVKLPAQKTVDRAFGQAVGLYEKEVRFYSELAAETPIPTPRCYFAGFDFDPAEQPIERFARAAGRTPGWATGLLLSWSVLKAVLRPHRYGLVLEDMARARPGDQHRGADVAQASRALATLARGHAHYWQRSDLGAEAWARPLDDTPKLTVQSVHRGLPKVLATRPFVDAHMRELGEWLLAHVGQLMERIGTRPRTLCHGDYRLDNLFFQDDPGAPVLAIDWQTIMVGPAAYDLAYFISGSLADELREDDVAGLVRGYHAALVEAGVGDYGLEDLLDDYRHGMVAVLGWFGVMASTVHFEENPGLGALLDMWGSRLARRLQPIEPGQLLQS